MKKLLIVTNEFPFGKRETFLESEINVISTLFDEITIIPTKKVEGQRSLPSNVKVDTIIADSYSKKLSWTLKTVFTAFLYKTLSKYSKKIDSIVTVKMLFKYSVAFTIVNSFVSKILRKYSGYIIYSYWFSPAADAFANHKNNSFRLFTRVHRGDLYEEFTPLGFYPYREKFIGRFNGILSISDDGVAHLHKKYDANNVYCSRLGTLDYGWITQKSADNDISIVSVSNIIPVKRVGLIAESLVLFANEHPENNIVWHHFGDGHLKAEILEYLKTSNCPNLTTNFYGMVSNTKIFEFYKSNTVDAFVNISESEGIPVSIMEAISFGIPVLATNVGGVAEIVTAQTGLLLQADCTKQTVSTQLGLLLNSDLPRASVKEFWDNNYNAVNNYTKVAEQFISI